MSAEGIEMMADAFRRCPDGIPCLSLWQPWGSAMMLGLKSNETRHWSTKYRGPLLIHAALRKIDAESTEFYRQYFIEGQWARMPLGAILGMVELVDCVPTESLSVFGTEYNFGNYEAGRFAWQCRLIAAFETPIPYKGHQGIFKVPKSVLVQYPDSARVQGELMEFSR